MKSPLMKKIFKTLKLLQKCNSTILNDEGNVIKRPRRTTSSYVTIFDSHSGHISITGLHYDDYRIDIRNTFGCIEFIITKKYFKIIKDDPFSVNYDQEVIFDSLVHGINDESEFNLSLIMELMLTFDDIKLIQDFMKNKKSNYYYITAL